MSKKVTPLMEQELFERGLVIRRAWIMPPGCWEYYVARVGDIRSPSIAIRSTRQAAYNAAIRYLSSLPNTASTRQGVGVAKNSKVGDTPCG